LLSIVAGATDDVGLQRVRFLVDGSEVGFSIRAPYSWDVAAPPAGTVMRIQVIAVDTMGHQTASPEITVTSIPDPLTEVRGRTVDVSGAPVSGARVEAEGAFAISGADGSFSLAGLPTNEGDFPLTASAVVGAFQLHGTLDVDVSPIPGGVAEVGDLVLSPDDPGAALTGRMVDEAGSPLPGSTVKVYSDHFLAVTTAGSDGRFTVTGAPSQGGLTVSGSASSGGTRLRGVIGASATAGEVTDLGEIVLSPVDEEPDPGTTVRGTVVEAASGSPVAGANVFVFTTFDVVPAVSGADGTFSIASVPTLDGDLSATASAAIAGIFFTATLNAPPVPGDSTDFGIFYLAPAGGGGVYLLPPEYLQPRSSLPLLAWRLEGPVCPAVQVGRWSIFGGL
jgi:hypothetical protein